jgi:hypothetical protein
MAYLPTHLQVQICFEQHFSIPTPETKGLNYTVSSQIKTPVFFAKRRASKLNLKSIGYRCTVACPKLAAGDTSCLSRRPRWLDEPSSSLLKRADAIQAKSTTPAEKAIQATRIMTRVVMISSFYLEKSNNKSVN